MTPQEKIKKEILLIAIQQKDISFNGEITSENLESLYQQLIDDDLHWDYENEMRHGEIETNLPSQFSRHYEAKEVARKMSDGSWIGWTYWYGGGKFGEPEAIDWMSEAYDLSCKEEEKVIIVRTFEKK